MSKQFVYVRVVGKVPAADMQNDIILKVSSEAADKLKVSEDKFLVEVTGYVKEWSETLLPVLRYNQWTSNRK